MRRDATVNRRQFILLLSGLGVTAAAGGLLTRGVLLRHLMGRQTVTCTRPMMGTSVSINVMDTSTGHANEAAETAFAEMARLEGLLSRYRVDSLVSQLNRYGHVDEAPKELLDVLDRAGFFSELSAGAFDATVKPIVDLVATSFAATGHAPASEKIAEALRHVNYRGVVLAGRTVRMEQGMGVTLDGIAKGYIIDRAVETLKSCDCGHALVEAGGDLRTLGGKDESREWRIGIRDPLGGQEPLRIMKVADRAVATSGDYEIFFDEDKNYFHIVDPRTGISPRESHSVTVVARSAMDADALATALLVLGPQKGLDLIERLEGAECFIVLRGGGLVESSGISVFWES